MSTAAQVRNQIVAGKTAQPRWKGWFVDTVVQQLLNRSGDIDIYVVSGEGEIPPAVRETGAPKVFRWGEYLKAAAVVAACGVVGWFARSRGLADANIVMIFLAGVAFVSARLGRGPSIASAIASVLVFDFFFVPPRLTFAVGDSEYLITFAVMLGIGLLISELTARLQAQLRASQQQEHRQRSGQMDRDIRGVEHRRAERSRVTR